MRRELPTWRDEWSDGCSGPDWIHRIFQPPLRACLDHDRRYYYGGSELHRKAADESFRLDLIKHGLSAWKARVYCRAVKLGGHPAFHIKKVSWSFGGKFFAYADKPATGVISDA